MYGEKQVLLSNRKLTSRKVQMKRQTKICLSETLKDLGEFMLPDVLVLRLV